MEHQFEPGQERDQVDQLRKKPFGEFPIQPYSEPDTDGNQGEIPEAHHERGPGIKKVALDAPTLGVL